ncbi:MAG: amidophosphoribosyltransferase [Micavibrio aeruginosavorus]|uniref:Amidophosphoribosyltransferase n=1 Tax=Micavibrio aeruginosavorus TaxID=349221 RepID=A0A2W5PK74_9BACT|nr:MAG: amidophosphoribosyltransferase [Micavibrio aeruginosavorus]
MLTTNPFNDDKLHEECGVFGIFGHPESAAMTALGLHALQHRGQEAAGIVSFDGNDFYVHKAMGLVDATFSKAKVIDKLKGYAAIGHNRYSTTGEASLRNVQPIYADLALGGFAVAHNGNLTNAAAIREELVHKGSLFQSTSDTEVIVHLMAVSPKQDAVAKLIEAVNEIKGAYSLVAVTEDMLIGVRDPFGIRPLVLGKLGGSYIMTSETCALDIIGAEFVRDIKPGEMVVVDKKGLRSQFPFKNTQSRFCIFEYVYFARPDSMLEGNSVYEMRKNIGAVLAKESPVKDADVVVPVPDSGVPSAIGYSQASGVPFELGIIRNHYVGRTFIEPTAQIRNLGVKLKHNANAKYLKDKIVVLVDDSIVRGTTSRKIVEMVRAAGAKEVHMRISSPPTAHSCFYGIDTPSTEELMAHTHTLEQIKDHIGVDSLAYISVDGLYQAVGETKRNNEQPQYCDACFTGEYPVELVDKIAGCTTPKVKAKIGAKMLVSIDD